MPPLATKNPPLFSPSAPLSRLGEPLILDGHYLVITHAGDQVVSASGALVVAGHARGGLFTRRPSLVLP